MGEVLFRGKHIHASPQNKHIDGHWIEGYLCDENHINSSELGGEFLIDPNTVGQYTGKTDKCGSRIFDGDILNMTYEGEESVYIVFWSSEDAMWKIRSIDADCADDMRYWDPTEWKIIGNIFDNPEMLERTSWE